PDEEDRGEGEGDELGPPHQRLTVIAAQERVDVEIPAIEEAVDRRDVPSVECDRDHVDDDRGRKQGYCQARAVADWSEVGGNHHVAIGICCENLVPGSREKLTASSRLGTRHQVFTTNADCNVM